MPTKKVRKRRSATKRPQGQYRTRVIVKFRDHIQLPYDRAAAQEIEKRGIGPWERLADEYKGITLEPLFTSKKPNEILALVQQAREMDSTYAPTDFLSYFAVNIPVGVDAASVAKSLSTWPSVSVAYVEPPPIEPPIVNATDDPRSGNQGYLDPAPDGIDAEYAWGFPGGDGTGQALVDMEWGWTFNHEDLVALGITLISGMNNSYFFHGTGVLGEIAARDNTVGCVGITPNAPSVRCVGQWLTGGGYSTSQPILDAIAVMSFGDVLILEAQTALWGYANVPVEIEPAVFDVIRLATALGIVVTEAAGNGGVDLDTVVNPGGQQIFNRASTDFRDSGAIIVGAASSAAPHTRMGFSCFGSRVDCYGWGQNVDTLSTNGAGTATDLYTTTFNGTSSATPIVTGAALVLQGLAEARPFPFNDRFAPWQVRTILSDPANGTLSQNPAMDRIGVMPNLRAIIDGSVLNLAPDVYLRDFVGDTGDPHTGAISASPDVILRQTAEGDPQMAFGEGSGTENSSTLGFEAEAGQDNFIYVRVRNRGGTDAANVQATVYWAPPATLVTPNLWTLVGSTTIANVPTGDILTVSDAIVWPAAAIPGTGHYCFVALIGNAQDPAPAAADFLNWANYQLFIRANNNVTWRNFNVVNNVPPSAGEPPNYVPLPFIMAGAPDNARRMRLEVGSRLPRDAEAVLEMPKEFAQLVRARGKSLKGARNPRVVHVPVNPCGRTTFVEAAIPAKAQIPMRLLVQVPKNLRKYEFEIFARQLYENEEVGRVTWRLAPSRKRE
jgi:Subtilase family